jgi:hypothetical protein
LRSVFLVGFKNSTGEQLRNNTPWQTAFIRDNFPVLGYFAWQGFQRIGVGLLFCDVEIPPIEAELRLHPWKSRTQFVAGRYLATCLGKLEIPPLEVTSLVKAIEQYSPQGEIMLMIHSHKSVEIAWLRNLAIDPPDCYRQVCDRWDEFMPEALLEWEPGCSYM